MELNATSRSKGGRTVSRTAAGAANRASGPVQSGVTRIQRDRVSISSQTLRILEEQNRRALEQARLASEDHEGRSGGEALLEDMGEKLRMMNNCQKIFARVSAGDNVPPEDLRYLMKHDMAGYRLAMAMRKPKEHPEDCKSVLNEEERAQVDSCEPATDLSETASAGRPL